MWLQLIERSRLFGLNTGGHSAREGGPLNLSEGLFAQRESSAQRPPFCCLAPDEAAAVRGEAAAPQGERGHGRILQPGGHSLREGPQPAMGAGALLLVGFGGFQMHSLITCKTLPASCDREEEEC